MYEIEDSDGILRMRSFFQSGGLADMVSSLSKQFAADGYDVKVFTPLYSSVKRTPKFVKNSTISASIWVWE